MKYDIILVIKILGIGLEEIFVEIDLDSFKVQSIEYREPNDIVLHSFVKEGYDQELSFDDLEKRDQRYIHRLLTTLVYN
jgi:hypothetical protein